MTDIRTIMENYKEVRNRLRRPSHAVPDIGIDLHRQKASPHLEPEPEPMPVRERPPYIPFRRTDLTFSSTLRFAAVEWNITTDDIKSRKRSQEFCLPRQVAIWLAAHNHLQTLAGMGRYLKMDHTTMIHARDKITSLMASDATLRDRILKLEATILAAFDRVTLSPQHKPHLGSKEAEGHEAVRKVPCVDKGS